MPERQPITDVAIVFILILSLITGLPHFIPGVRWVEKRVDIFADVTGLEQSNWKLFAPEVDKVNTWIQVDVTYRDGTSAVWRTQDWSDRSLWDKLVQGRLPKIHDYQRRDNWPALHGALARYVVRELAKEGHPRKPKKVVMTRHWWTIPSPNAVPAARENFETYPPPREAYPKSYVYYERELP